MKKILETEFKTPIKRKSKITNSEALCTSDVYAEVNEKKHEWYYDYQNQTSIVFNSTEDYSVLQKIGRGKYSDVYKADRCGDICVVKLLKPMKNIALYNKKVKREIKILQNITGGPNCIRLFDIVKDPVSSILGFVFEWVDNESFMTLYPSFKDHDVRYYMYQLLRAVHFCHSRGIMHRDIKPQNVMIDHKRRKLRLIDWGLAEFYHPLQSYNIRVASRFFKPPELLVTYRLYDYSLDMWSLGCMFAGIIFQKHPFFRGADNHDQLVKIADVLGTEKLYLYLEKYEIELKPDRLEHLGNKEPRPWFSFKNFYNLKYMSKEAIDFLDKLLRYDHKERLWASQAKQHQYFSPLSAEEKNDENDFDPDREPSSSPDVQNSLPVSRYPSRSATSSYLPGSGHGTISGTEGTTAADSVYSSVLIQIKRPNQNLSTRTLDEEFDKIANLHQSNQTSL